MSDRQTAMWERPREVDATPLETGGAVVTVRLSPGEVTFLRPYAPTLVEAIHHALIAAKNLISESADEDDLDDDVIDLRTGYRVTPPDAPQGGYTGLGASQSVAMDTDATPRLSAAPDGAETP